MITCCLVLLANAFLHYLERILFNLVTPIVLLKGHVLYVVFFLS